MKITDWLIVILTFVGVVMTYIAFFINARNKLDQIIYQDEIFIKFRLYLEKQYNKKIFLNLCNDFFTNDVKFDTIEAIEVSNIDYGLSICNLICSYSYKFFIIGRLLNKRYQYYLYLVLQDKHLIKYINYLYKHMSSHNVPFVYKDLKKYIDKKLMQNSENKLHFRKGGY